ncbi:MarR family winged helix-turn-helix transcriptional regulator [Pseudarthrobacter sulfonivorans]|uniref:MarR family winged helix-turn-helix transcriptional regulator n=1 Tax=Pseudarthrobacter sulfonivorans TaxID=121292 RepID=UPI00210466DC|nr:MarR family transcriptional regulator [Pseudarthrobacter sulfonivorans]
MPESQPATPPDYVDRVRHQWEQIFPGLETSSADIVARIHRIGQIIQLRSDAVLAENGITRAEFDMLSLLARTGRPMGPTELAGELLISGAGATKRIRKLLDAGLVQRDTNPQDGRGALVRMTPEARTRLRPILESVLTFEAGMLAALDTAAAGHLAGDLRSLLTALEPGPGAS